MLKEIFELQLLFRPTDNGAPVEPSTPKVEQEIFNIHTAVLDESNILPQLHEALVSQDLVNQDQPYLVFDALETTPVMPAAVFTRYILPSIYVEDEYSGPVPGVAVRSGLGNVTLQVGIYEQDIRKLEERIFLRVMQEIESEVSPKWWAHSFLAVDMTQQHETHGDWKKRDKLLDKARNLGYPGDGHAYMFGRAGIQGLFPTHPLVTEVLYGTISRTDYKTITKSDAFQQDVQAAISTTEALLSSLTS